MKQVLERDELHEALVILSRLVPVTNTSTLYIETLETATRISVMGENNGAYALVCATIQEEGTALLSFSLLASLVAKLPHEEVSMETKETHCFLHTKKTKARLLLYDNETYTSAYSLKAQTTATLFTVSAKDFKEIVEDVAFAADKKGERAQFLTCICIQPTAKGDLDFVTTDSFVMAHRTVQQSHNMTSQLLIPASEMRSVASSLKKDGSPISCTISPNGHIIGISDGIFEYFTKALDGIFPMFQYVYPSHVTLSVTAATNELLASVISAGSFLTPGVVFEIKGNVLTVLSPETEEGESVTVVDSSIQGKETKILLSSESVQNILRHINHENVTFACDPDGMRHAVVFIPGDQRVRYVIIPMGGKSA